jgi:HEAT repeat protein
VLQHLVDLLADPEKEARMGAARALGGVAGPEPALLLRLKLLQGDPEVEVLAEGFRALLSIESPEEGASFVARFLASEDETVAESAALALGESRNPRAFEVLKDHWERARGKSFRRVLLVAMALLRTEPATDFLVALLSDASGETRRGALSALGPFLYSGELRKRVRAAVEDDADLKETYEAEIRKNGLR